MKIEQIIQNLKKQKILLLPLSELDEILAQVEIIQQLDTFMSDFIRILKQENSIFVQEMTRKEEIALRLFDSVKEAEMFVTTRMATYEKMWDGCGCKVDYYS